ncbi:MAG: DNA-processing protein DprA [Alphaproteobacteria bacterium]
MTSETLFETEAEAGLAETERLAWLRLIRTENVGPVTFADLLRRFGTASAALDALPRLARRGGRARDLRICPVADAEHELEATVRAGARMLCLPDPDYPEALRAIDSPPPVICVRGDTEVLNRPAVAMVGARNASANGRRFARDMAAALGTHGFTVVSGLARGIDTAAHEGGLDTGTAAVLAGGIGHVYPAENEALFSRIAKDGCLVSEMPAGFVPQARHFPRRNRLVSGLALGVLVVEAAQRSGSLITARCALEQGREVFAVPGSPLDPRARGSNGLIRQGAMLVQEPGDILDALAAALHRPFRERAPAAAELFALPDPAEAEADSAGEEDARAALFDLLGPSPVAQDELVRQSGLPAATVAAIMLEWELAGRVSRQPGQLVARLDS